MDSGVIIIKKDSLEIKFYNKAAESINLNLRGKRPLGEASVSSFANLAPLNIKSNVRPCLDLSGKNLAIIDETLLYKPGIRSNSIVKAYEAQDNYISIHNII